MLLCSLPKLLPRNFAFARKKKEKKRKREQKGFSRECRSTEIVFPLPFHIFFSSGLPDGEKKFIHLEK